MFGHLITHMTDHCLIAHAGPSVQRRFVYAGLHVA